MRFNHIFCLSIASSTLSLTLLGGLTMAQAGALEISGRWTTIDKAAFSENGMFYKTIDIIACEAGICGVSVGDGGECGSTLFSLDAAQGAGKRFTGTGRWGKLARELQIDVTQPDPGGAAGFVLSLEGTERKFESRLASMPEYIAVYASAGNASCQAQKPVS